MTNNHLLIETIMTKLRTEVDQYVTGMCVDEDVLDKAEERSRQFAQTCGGIVFDAHIQACLAAQNYGFVGDSVSTGNGGTANFERYEERWVLPSAQSGTLYIMMDGGRINTITEGWREPKVATLFWGDDVVEVSKERRFILKKEYVAVLGDADELAERLWAAACRWEWWKAERVVVLGDGAPWIWNRASDLFPNATQILDLYHAKEHIWETARQLYCGAGKQKDKGAGISNNPSSKDRKTAEWARARISELKKGNIDAILKTFEADAPSERKQHPL